MNSLPRRAVFLFLVAFSAASVRADDPPAPTPLPVTVTLGPLPDLPLPPAPPPDPATAARVKSLIDGLATLDKPDFGLSPTLSGSSFAPLPDQASAGVVLLTDHDLHPSDAVKSLVALGADALPFLLAALDDPRPTKIEITDEHAAAIWHDRELPLNPVNPVEQAAYHAQPPPSFTPHPDVKSYPVKVGDVCFVALGQIVGRAYSAARYQPTACVVLNCPADDPEFCARVRSIWQGKDPRRTLFDSLRADYATHGIFNGKSLDGWDQGSGFQCEAALRLLYYFPATAAPLVAARLDKFDVNKTGDLDAFTRREVANGLRTEDFIPAVAWSKEPAVRAALARLFYRASDARLALAALPAVDDSDEVHRRLETLLAAVPPGQDGPYTAAFYLLVALARRAPADARPVFARYLQEADAMDGFTACVALRDVKPVWDADLLLPLLADRRSLGGWTYPVDPDKNEPRLPIRVCDEAALTLAGNHPVLKFTQAGTHADLDRQIAAIRATLEHAR